ncbi:MAG: TonB-dependent receptor [Solimonas sp.]
MKQLCSCGEKRFFTTRIVGVAALVAATPFGVASASGTDGIGADATPTAIDATELASAAQPDADAGADDSADGVSEVVVTARNRHEDAQAVPIALSSVSADQLEAIGGAANIKQIQSLFPSLQIQGYSGRNQTLTIRGLGTNAGGTNDGLEQGVGLYIDGVYRPRTGTLITDMLDVADVQVLRGPQGTLFGKNTVAGAIDVHTRAPSFTPEASVEGTFGNYDYHQLRGSVSGALSGDLAARFSVVGTQRDGIVRNVYFNKDWDDLNNGAAKIDLLYRPSDAFSARLIADYSIQYGDMGFYLLGRVLPTTLASGTTVTGFYEHAEDVSYDPITVDPYARRTDINRSQFDRMPSGGVSLQTDAQLGEFALKSITAWRSWDWLPHWDGDQFGADIMKAAVVRTHQRQVSEELRLTSPEGRAVEYTGGLYFFWQRAHDDQNVVYGSDAAKWYLGSTAPDALFDGLSAYSLVVPQTYSYAAYGQGTWHVAPSWDVIGGLRYTYERKLGSYSAEQRGDVASISDLPDDWQSTAQAYRDAYAPSGDDYETQWSKGNLSGQLSLSHAFADNVHGYASYSRGYKSAGINLVRRSSGINVLVDPEKVDAYELGLKSSAWGRRLEFNTALFWTEDSDYQANLYDLSTRTAYIGSAGKVRSRGVEADLRAQPLTHLSITLSGAYDDAEYRSYKNAICPFLKSDQTSCDISGQPLSGTSKWAGALTSEYALPAFERGEVYVGGDLTYRSSFYSAVNDDPYSRVGTNALVGAHLGLRSVEGWDVMLWGRNLLDRDYLNTAVVNSSFGVTQVAVGEPRTYGIALRANF